MSERERKAFLDGMAAMWLWTHQSRGLSAAIKDGKWSNAIAEQCCEDKAEIEELLRLTVERFSDRFA